MATLKRPRVLCCPWRGGARCWPCSWRYGCSIHPSGAFGSPLAPPRAPSIHFAQRYSDILRREGVQLELVATTGALDNLARLQDPKSGVDAALLEGGSTTAEKSPDLVSLGTLYYRPVWVFYRGRMPLPGQPWPATLRLSLGPEGGNPANLSRRLLLESGAPYAEGNLLYLGREAAADSLLAGTIDIAAIVAPWESPTVQRLLRADSVHLAGFPRAEARVALHPELTHLVLPEGVVDLARDIPSHDVQLVASKMSMAARRSLHPALQYLLLEALSEVHGGARRLRARRTVPRRGGRRPAAQQGGRLLPQVGHAVPAAAPSVLGRRRTDPARPSSSFPSSASPIRCCRARRRSMPR